LFSFFSPPDPLVVFPENEEEALVTIVPLLEDPLETTKHFFRLLLSPSAKNATFVDVVKAIFVLFVVVVIIAALLFLLLFSTSSWTLIGFLPLGKILLPNALSLLLLLDDEDGEDEVDNEEEGEEHQRWPKGI
jgi:hypothetical protein|tara:strand:- start:2362 stop:2760 length:399 start_codon:yes stop_codon:yes gene_type:complete